MGEQNFSWKVVAAARGCSVHFDKETNIQLYLQPRRMDAHKDSLSITGNPGPAVSSSIFPVGVMMSLLRFYPASSWEVKSPSLPLLPEPPALSPLIHQSSKGDR